MNLSKRLKEAIEVYANTLLSMPYPTQAHMIDAIGYRTEDDRILTFTKEPRARLVSERTMGGGDSYWFELQLGALTVGFTVITNLDRHSTRINAFLEIVPVYYVDGNRVDWWCWATPSDAFLQVLTEIFERMTNYLAHARHTDPALCTET